MMIKVKILLFTLFIATISISQNNGLDFDGINDYVTLDEVSGQLEGVNSFTIEFWMKSTSVPGGNGGSALFAINNISNNLNGLLLMIRANGALGVSDLTNWEGFTGETIINDGECHHVVYKRSGNSAFILVDGELQSTQNTITTTFNISSSDRVSLAQEWDGYPLPGINPSNFFKGEIDDLRIWDYARTDVEILNNMQANFFGNEPGLIALYRFNQGISQGDNTAISEIINSSDIGTSLNGGIVNMSMSGASSNFTLSNCSISCPGFSIDVQSSPSCENSSTGQLIVTPNSTPSFSYQWGAGANLETDSIVDALAPGTYQVTITDGDGCVEDTIIEVLLLQGSSAGADSSIAFCFSESGITDLNDLLSSGTSGGIWSETSGMASGQFTNISGVLDLSNLAVGSYTFDYTIPAFGICPGDDASMTITINDIPYIDNPTDETVCDVYVLPDINGTSLTTGVGYFTAPNGGGINLAIGENITTAGANTIYVYDAISTMANCFDQDTFIVTVNITPTIDDIANVTLCDSYSLPAVVSGTNITSNAGFYTAPAGGGIQLANGSAITTAGANSVYIYDETATTPNCATQEDFVVTINITPDVDDITDGIECDMYNLPAAIPGVITTLNGGFFTAPSGGGTQLVNGTSITATQTVYIYDETATTPNCFDQEDFLITVNYSVDAGADGVVTLCNSAGNEVTLSNLLVGADTGGVWSETTGLPHGALGVASGVFNPATSVFDPTELTPQEYTFMYLLSTNAPCINDTAFFSINVSGHSQAGADSLIKICNDSIIDLNTLLEQGVSGGTWTEISFSNQFNSTVGIFDANSLQEGNYEFEYEIQSIAPCPNDVALVSVQVLDFPQPLFSLDVPIGCIEHTVEFSYLTTAETNYDCLWDFGDNTTAMDCGGTFHVYTEPGVYDVSLTITNDNTCAKEFNIANAIEVLDVPVANFSMSPSVIGIEESTVNFTNLSSNANSFIWDFGDDSDSSIEVHPEHLYPGLEPGNYEVMLTASNEFGCFDTFGLSITVADELYLFVPNAFTPDNDGFNQIFIPIISSGYRDGTYKFEVYNRWGELIFVSNEVEIGWDGTYKGKNCMDGTYVWKVYFGDKFTDDKHVKTGHLTLLR